MTEEIVCCGNGCANCVLDQKPKKELININKNNIIEKYCKFKLISKTKYNESEDVYILHFAHCLELPNSTDYILQIPSGNHVMLKATIPEHENGIEKKLFRPYSPFTVNSLNMDFKILVNLQPNGLMSKYIRKLQESDKAEFYGPIGGDYVHKADSDYLILISQGVAIAPTLPIIKEILESEDETRIIHFACFSDIRHAYFRKELHDFSKYWNYSSRIYLSREQCQYKECTAKESTVGKCSHIISQLYYKENVFLMRLSENELCNNCKGKYVINKCSFVISGSRKFQDQMAATVKNKLDVIDENIYLL